MAVTLMALSLNLANALGIFAWEKGEYSTVKQKALFLFETPQFHSAWYCLILSDSCAVGVSVYVTSCMVSGMRHCSYIHRIINQDDIWTVVFYSVIYNSVLISLLYGISPTELTKNLLNN